MKKRKIAMLVITGVLLTGCMGTNYLEEGVSQLEEKQYEEASESFQKEKMYFTNYKPDRGPYLL